MSYKCYRLDPYFSYILSLSLFYPHHDCLQFLFGCSLFLIDLPLISFLFLKEPLLVLTLGLFSLISMPLSCCMSILILLHRCLVVNGGDGGGVSRVACSLLNNCLHIAKLLGLHVANCFTLSKNSLLAWYDLNCICTVSLEQLNEHLNSLLLLADISGHIFSTIFVIVFTDPVVLILTISVSIKLERFSAISVYLLIIVWCCAHARVCLIWSSIIPIYMCISIYVYVCVCVYIYMLLCY